MSLTPQEKARLTLARHRAEREAQAEESKRILMAMKKTLLDVLESENIALDMKLDAVRLFSNLYTER